MVLSLYRSVTHLAYPFVWCLLEKRKRIGKEDLIRGKERKGFYTKKRPEGRLIWLHGASVGECLSMMPLVNYLVQLPDTHVMVTSGTVTSANLMQKRLPKGAFHQFIPVDLPKYTKRFVKHFKPDIGMFFESDFWPNMLIDAHKAKIPMILLNGRISDKSYNSWKKLPFFIKPLLSKFTFGLGQTDEDAKRMKELGFKQTDCVGNIKFSAVPAPYNEEELKNLKSQIKGRFVWVAGSTHDNEEMQAIEIHEKLSKKYKGLLTIIVPRHPERCEELAKQIQEKGWVVHRRSKRQNLKADIFLGDTIGEMGLFYRLSNLVFVGGSLVEFGGQNMLEPMRIGACTFVGPHTFNFKEIIRKAKKQQAIIEEKNNTELAEKLMQIYEDKTRLNQIRQSGEDLANSETAVLERIVKVLTPFLEK